MRKLTITLNEATARIIADMLQYYNLVGLMEAEKREQLKVNSPYINAIKDFLKAYEEAQSEGGNNEK